MCFTFLVYSVVPWLDAMLLPMYPNIIWELVIATFYKRQKNFNSYITKCLAMGLGAMLSVWPLLCFFIHSAVSLDGVCERSCGRVWVRSPSKNFDWLYVSYTVLRYCIELKRCFYIVHIKCSRVVAIVICVSFGPYKYVSLSISIL